MAQDTPVQPLTLDLDKHPARYTHWKLTVDGPLARLDMNVQPDQPLDGRDYVLKLNSYDLGVDLELADAIQRVRFEHPEVRCLLIGSLLDKIFCSGANIYMLGSSSHAFKVNFCKFTNETRLSLEDLAAHSGVATIAALNGTASGGGYELALACDRILLIDDGNSAVSFPEAPLLAVLPGTGGLTRLVDKRKVRRDRADVFSTLVEGVRGKRAVEWNLVDELVPRSRWEETVKKRVGEAIAAKGADRAGARGIELPPLNGKRAAAGIEFRYVTLKVDTAKRVAELTVRAPDEPQPQTGAAFQERGAESWCLRAFRELDEALLRLRFEHPAIGLITLRTAGDIEQVLAADRGLLASQDHWLGREILSFMRRTLKRLDNTAKSLFALIEPGSCFAGSLFEIAVSADRSYMLNTDEARVALSPLNGGPLPGSNGLTRLQTRFLGEPQRVQAALEAGTLDAEGALEHGLVTFAPDDLDWEDEVRLAIEERANFSPDALTGMEQNLRFAGPETMETKIFGRLSAWQNWIFQRPNAVGPRGALTSYGKQTRPEFDMNRT